MRYDKCFPGKNESTQGDALARTSNVQDLPKSRKSFRLKSGEWALTRGVQILFVDGQKFELLLVPRIFAQFLVRLLPRFPSYELDVPENSDAKKLVFFARMSWVERKEKRRKEWIQRCPCICFKTCYNGDLSASLSWFLACLLVERSGGPSFRQYSHSGKRTFAPDAPQRWLPNLRRILPRGALSPACSPVRLILGSLAVPKTPFSQTTNSIVFLSRTSCISPPPQSPSPPAPPLSRTVCFFYFVAFFF